MLEIAFPLIPQELLNNLSFWVSALTLLVVGIYTFFAARQVSEMVYLRRLSLLPKLTARIRGTDNPFGGAALNLTNVGNGTAVNVNIEFPIIYWQKGTRVRVWCNPFKSVVSTTGKKATSAEMEIHLGGFDCSQEMTEEIMDSLSVSNFLGKFNGYDEFFDRFTITATFEDISGNKYMQNITLDDDGGSGKFRYLTYSTGKVRRPSFWLRLLDIIKPRGATELEREWRWRRKKYTVNLSTEAMSGDTVESPKK